MTISISGVGSIASGQDTQGSTATRGASITFTNSNGNSSIFTEAVHEGLSTTRSLFSSITNRVITVANVNNDHLDKATTIVNAQLDAANRLKQSYERGDSGEKQQAVYDLQKLAERRNVEAKKIVDDNQTYSSGTSTTLTDPSSSTPIQVNPVSFSSANDSQSKAPIDLNNISDINTFINSLTNDQQDLSAQKSTLKDTQTKIEGVVKDSGNTLHSLENTSVYGLADAENLVTKIASDIKNTALRQFTSQSLFDISNLSPDRVQSLLNEAPI